MQMRLFILQPWICKWVDIFRSELWLTLWWLIQILRFMELSIGRGRMKVVTGTQRRLPFDEKSDPAGVFQWAPSEHVTRSRLNHQISQFKFHCSSSQLMKENGVWKSIKRRLVFDFSTRQQSKESTWQIWNLRMFYKSIVWNILIVKSIDLKF